MDFLEQETEFRKLQIKKDIALANAEEAAASKFPKEREFSDYLIRCRDSMKTMKSLEELNSSETLLQVRLCRHAFELRRRTEGSVTFSDLVEFVKSGFRLFSAYTSERTHERIRKKYFS